MTRPRSRLPFEPIAHPPELAILCALDEILDLARRTLLAAHPTLGDPDAPYWVAERDALCRAARVLIARSATLHRAIRSYENAATELRAHSDDGSDLPF
jgi:hypothetical protein